MGAYWNSFGFIGATALVSFWLMAAFVWVKAAHRAAKWRLSLLFIVEGTSVGTCTGLIMFMGEPAEAYAVRALSAFALVLLPPVYLWFLGTLDTPLVRPLRSPWAQVGLGLAGALSVGLILLEPQRFVGVPVNPWYARWDVPYGPWAIHAFQVMGLVGLFALGAAVHAYVRAPRGGLARQQAKAFAVAFGMRDILYALFIFVVLPNIGGDRIWGVLWRQGAPVYTTAFLGVLGYGIFKTQLFDIDLKVKVAIQRSTVLASFVLVFFLVSEGIEALVSSQAGTWAGLATAGLLALGIRRLERGASVVADRIMPAVKDTPAYRDSRKREVYAASFESAIRTGGVVTKRERALLGAFRQQLGLTARDARVIERRVAAHAERAT